MKNDGFAFFNQQLAAMARDGIPLETALRRLCAEMRRGRLRDELEKLEADLSQGTPLREAARARQLPALYRQMLEVGAQSNDLPGVLTLLADHYHRRQLIWTRLKGLMVYPAIVLVATLLLSCFLSSLLTLVWQSVAVEGLWVSSPSNLSTAVRLSLMDIWLPPLILAAAAGGALLILAAPSIRHALRWRLPGFKEASLSQFASALALMLKSGVPLENSLALVEQLERGTPAAPALAQWRQRLAAGQGKISEIAAPGKVFPPLFVWAIAQSGADLPGGFQRAAELYQSRASYRTEILLYSALPLSVLALGLVVLSQVQPILAFLIMMLNAIGSLAG